MKEREVRGNGPFLLPIATCPWPSVLNRFFGLLEKLVQLIAVRGDLLEDI